MKKSLLAVTGILILASCEKVIEYEGSGKAPLLVVNSINETDSTIRVQLLRSIFFLEADPQTPAITSGAQLTLTNETTGQTWTPGPPDTEGNYEFPATALQGNNYRIFVSHPSYKSVQATMSVPGAVPVTGVDTSGYFTASGPGLQSVVQWNDPYGKNYYVLKVFGTYVSTGQNISDELLVSSGDPSLDAVSASGVGDEERYVKHLFFTDELFDGTAKALNVRIRPQISGSEYLHYTFHLFNCSEDTYKYLVSTEKAMDASGDFFSEPVKVFTNIENGYGIFSTMARAVFIK
jgi:hypothetical protein